jgi:RimJ/RimL family protein N-acetyltransferase
MPGHVFLRGERVTLHPVEEEDIEFTNRLINDPEVRRSLGMFSPHNATSSEQWLEQVAEDDEGVNLLIVADGDPVGAINLDRTDHWDAVVGNVSYYVAPEAQGNGYATDALRTICRYAFEERGFDKVAGHVFADNDASRHVLETVGFREEGVHRREGFLGGELIDVVYLGLLPDEFEA